MTRHAKIPKVIVRFFCLSLLSLTGCASYPVNPAINTLDFEDRVDFAHMRPREKLDDEILFFMTFSGGGTRAAALSYGVLEKLANTSIEIDGQPRRLLDEVDVISSVSGGSFTAAYYGLFGEQIFEDFETRFLKRNVQGGLIRQLSNPRNWFRLPSRTFGRSDLAAELYDKHLFQGLTFGDLRDRSETAIVINATDATQGTEFSFHQAQFDWICSNIAAYPVARAVAASSAVPGALGSITLRNHAGNCNFETPVWITQALSKRQTHTSEYQQANRIASYLDSDERPFIHLLDGGLSDNLGVRAILDQIIVLGGIVESLRGVGMGQIRKIVVIIVNAETASEKDLDLLERLPLLAQLKTASRVPINRYNYETISLLNKQLAQWRDEIVEARCVHKQSASGSGTDACADVDTYLIEVSFDALEDKSEQQYFKQLPTSFKLSDEEVDKLRDAAARILAESEEFNRLLTETQ
ncbi:MAG: patatin-like phospholipase family protein [Gammaproteobacteria bacterium]|nr:patatin-like phospholipase family protein [Gammaproteobacteria bacterium]